MLYLCLFVIPGAWMRRDLGFYGRQLASTARDYSLGLLQVPWHGLYSIARIEC